FAFSAESGTVWMYETDWYNSGDVVPDQITPASDAIPSNSVVNGSAGTSNEYARGDHQHPLQISTVLPAKDTANGEAGVATTYARSDHTHHVNLSNDIPLKDTGTGTAGTANIYASATHQHPLNVDPTTANVPLVNATAAANGSSDFYSRNDHVHPQQLTYDGNITATKFIKTGGLATEILCANGDTINGVVDIASDQTITVKAGQEGQADRGLQISADGNTLTFNGSVIAGTGASNGASNGSVQYSAGNPILWGENSTGTEGGFYSNGTNICWRARPITLGSVPP
ncbi:MAG: hypothetical protein EZS28_034867, partial [Streblomastix strix]